MHKIAILSKILILFGFLSLTSCLSINGDRVGETHQTKDEKDISLNWFASSALKETDIISSSEAKLFVINAYQTLDDKIFDPAFKKEERKQQLKELIAKIETKPQWSRSEITKILDLQLKKLKISHVKILDPVEGTNLFRLFEGAPQISDGAEPAVSTEIRGSLGIMRIKSFIVPQINKTAIAQAKARLSQAKVILLDLRGNGGGDIPSFIEDIVGADKIMSTDRTRKGLKVKEPYIYRGYYDDLNDEAGIQLLEEKGYIQWRTRFEAKKDPRPYFILVDDRCGSACELFAAIAQENESAKIVGVRTMGALLVGEAFKLKWQGFALVAPTAQVFSPKGNIIEGVGVEPDIQILECKNNGTQCLDRAIEVVTTHKR
ncbi:MAG: S41 family peptidase [Hydrococcus sp. Prado102]|jgi:C-terminal processing protease CtpA/Prc|nr:S41 family peptidase [Hydrococcus sp. Prado102]